MLLSFVRLLITFLLINSSSISYAAQPQPLLPEQVPEPLKPWTEWVLSKQPERACPFFYNNESMRLCHWASALELDLNEQGGRFSASWELDNDGYLQLPGDIEHAPLNVLINGKAAVVTWQGNKPVIYTVAGDYKISGEFIWERLPQSLQIPIESARLTLNIADKNIEFPRIEKNGQLWLKQNHQDREVVSDSVELSVFRKVIDEVPLRLLTRLQFTVSGHPREITLPSVLPEGFIPQSLSSRLPAQLSLEGSLTLQLSPGRWEIEIEARRRGGETEAIAIPLLAEPWPPYELWAFQAIPQHRLVDILGVTAVDPQQTLLPNAWKALPSYRVKPEDTLQFSLIRRGGSGPESNNLRLSRELWLDFDGHGYTVNDRLNGQFTQGWRLETQPGLNLGRVAVNGQPQLVTLEAGHKQPGVEIRQGDLSLEADSRINGNISDMSATGWASDFHQVSALLHLPPGWKLITANGVDSITGSWLQSWSLLDLFLVLITAIAVGRMWSLPVGIATLFGLVLIWQEPGAPKQIWLHLIVALALIRVLPKAGKAVRLVTWYRNAALLVLLLITIPFSLQLIRGALFPQLEMTNQSRAFTNLHAVRASSEMNTVTSLSDESLLADIAEGNLAPSARRKQQAVAMPLSAMSDSLQQVEQDPEARIQTGPGLPQWQWQQHQLQWNGPVEKEQRITLTLLSPTATAVLKCLQLVVVALFTGFLFNFITAIPLISLSADKQEKARSRSPISWFIGACLILGGSLIALPKVAVADVMPSEQMLEQLRERLTASPACLPNCANIAEMVVGIEDRTMSLDMEVHAVARVALPLPGQSEDWMLLHVTERDNEVKRLMRSEQGGLFIALDPGVHHLHMEGLIADINTFVITLPLIPRFVSLSDLGDWQIEGVNPSAAPDRQLQFFKQTDLSAAEETKTILRTALPPYFQVKRILRLGLEWTVETQVMRLSPLDSSAVTRVPLLKGESVISDGVSQMDQSVRVSMSAGQRIFSWRSRLEQVPQIELEARDNPEWDEVWVLDISPVWHPEINGIPMFSEQEGERARWLPEWRPWPGETVAIKVQRLKGVDGATLTIDRSNLILTPGQRTTSAQLDLDIRSSQGGQYNLVLPTSVSLDSVKGEGRALPVRSLDGQVTLPIHPGVQHYTLNFRSDLGISPAFESPKIDLTIPSVNHTLSVSLGENRWLLWTSGPLLGPVVLFWGTILLALMISLFLGKLNITPIKNWQWFLLMIGLLQLPIPALILVVATLLALGWHASHTASSNVIVYNIKQIGMMVLMSLSAVALYMAVEKGLLGQPEMQVSGYGSSGYQLNWYQDHTQAVLPQVHVFSVPVYVYRGLMLGWALWLAFTLIIWSKWSWQCLVTHGFWQKGVLVKLRAYLSVVTLKPYSQKAQTAEELPNRAR